MRTYIISLALTRKRVNNAKLRILEPKFKFTFSHISHTISLATHAAKSGMMLIIETIFVFILAAYFKEESSDKALVYPV